MQEKTLTGADRTVLDTAQRNDRATRRLMPKMLGPLEVVRRIGAGAAGAVYEARDPRTGQGYVVKALKKLSETDLERFKLEAEVMMKLHHRNLMPVVRVEAEADPPYFVMPLRAGTTLSERAHAAPLTLPFVLRTTSDVADGLAQAHSFGVIHRDVKPSNVFLDAEDGHAVLLDFGLAKVPSRSRQITSPGAMLGTPAYMAPEQCTGERVTERTDVYALGVCLVEMLLGVNPFRSSSLLVTVMLHAEATPRRLDALLPQRVPNELGELVERMLSKDAKNRPRASSVHAQLEAFLRDKRYVNGGEWRIADEDASLVRAFLAKN